MTIASRKMHFRFIHIFLILLVLVFNAPAYAQRINVQATVNKEEIVIGEYITLSLNIYIPKGTSIRYPVFHKNQLQNIEIIESEKIDTVFNSNESITLKQNIILTSYDTGINVIPGIRIPYIHGNTYDTASTPSIDIYVTGVVVDFSQDIRDINPPIAVPFNWREIIPYLFYIISFIALIGGAVWALVYFRKNNTGEEITVPKKIEPAHIEAIHQLDLLQQEKLIEKKQFREFHSRLTDHLRRYIERRFDISAMEKTSEEIFNFFKTEKVDTHSIEALEQILILADQVKFAKAKPSDQESEQSLKNAYYFVNNTKVTANASKERSEQK